jgi:spore germination protein YaaH
MKSSEFLSESKKQKGVDGKACWKGYKRMGTKQKGGKTVDNCVKMEGIDPADVGEYDREGEMAQQDLLTAADAANELRSILDADDNLPEWVQAKITKALDYLDTTRDYMKAKEDQHVSPSGVETNMDPEDDDYEINYGKAGLAGKFLEEQFDQIEEMVESLAKRHNVDPEVIWEDFETIDDSSLYAITEDWQKVNKKDRTDGMSKKAVSAYRRENPGSKLKTAVTTKPSKLKKGSKASKRRKSYCSRSKGQMNMHNISCAKTPDKAICKARRRWNC